MMDNRPTPGKITRNILLALLIVAAFAVSWRVTEVDFFKLVKNLPNGKDIILAFLAPDILTRDKTTTTIETPFPIPCGSAAEAEIPSSGPRLVPSVKCADPKIKFTLEGFNLAPNSDVVVRWNMPDGRVLTAVQATTDSNGHFSSEVESRPIASSVNGVAAKLAVETLTSVGGLKPSQAAHDVLEAMFVTFFMALLSTTFATIIAAPLSFLAASNITKRGPVGTTVYYVSRSVFNLLRSYDPLVMATIFGFWLSFGSFPGFLALTVVTIASLGKLFSEAVEGIDSGPLEALQATGANRLQVVVYGIIPQIVPNFVSFIIYHWDINIRISTIIGFVGGGGIGYYLSQKINLLNYHQAATAIWAIVVVVWSMDFLSSEVRKRMT
jgi:phosphonate transport system permease protein